MAAEEQTDSLDEDEVAIVIEIAVVRETGVEKIRYQLLEMCQRRNYYRRLLKLIKF